MNHFCYILYSKNLDKYYIGYTQDNLEKRLLKHQTAFYHNSFSKITNDWNVFFSISCECASQALAIEKRR
jgi:putative endonuclease